MKPKLTTTPKAGKDLSNFLVYDVETYATGFADPLWVPQVVTCIAWKWYGKPARKIQVRTSTDFRNPACPMPHLDPDAIYAMLHSFITDYLFSDGVITYNGARFDQPILNAMAWYTGIPPLPAKKVYDLHRFGRTKGMKKGLDNVAVILGVTAKKQAMNHAEWQEAYLEPGWPTIKARAKSDVILTEKVFDAVQERGWLKPATLWKP